MKPRPSIEVRRRILPWRPRWRGPRLDFGGGGGDLDGDADVPAGGGGGGLGLVDLLDDLAAGLLVAVAVVVLAATVVPVIVLAVEIVLVLLAAAVLLLSRLVLRHPWPVEATSTVTGDVIARWQVVGWRRAGRAQQQIQHRVAFGAELPPEGPYDPDAAA